jgi:hypothetical protein
MVAVRGSHPAVAEPEVAAGRRGSGAVEPEAAADDRVEGHPGIEPE